MAVYRSNLNPIFRSKFAEDIFNLKYRHEGAETWDELAATVAADVGHTYLRKDDLRELTEIIRKQQFLPGGRYLYYAGRDVKFFNNCFLLCAEEDTREDWANLSWKAESCLMSGGGIGVDYSIYRPAKSTLSRTGGESSGPIPKIQMINEIGRRVMQGGSRRSAIYGSLNWQHADVNEFLSAKDWDAISVPGTDMTLKDLKALDFNWPAPMDMTNISVNYDDDWLLNYWRTGDVGDIFKRNVEQALRTAEPGFSFNFFDKRYETLRNACTEVTANNSLAPDGGDDSDVCNLLKGKACS